MGQIKVADGIEKTVEERGELLEDICKEVGEIISATCVRKFVSDGAADYWGIGHRKIQLVGV